MKKKWYMMVTAFAILCTLVLIVGCAKQKQAKGVVKEITEVDFDTSMGKGNTEWRLAMGNADDVSRYTILKTMYEKNLPSKVTPSATPKIPKIIHQIWVGPKTPPSHFFTFRDKWLKMHPDWEYHLWTDADLDGLDLQLRDIIDASPNYAEKSDIIRSELLERFGGVYIDVDMDPFVALDDLHMKYDFYAGAEYPHKIATTNNMVWVGISIIASKPHHPVLKRWKEYIRARWEMVNQTYSSPVERVINHTYFPFSFAFFEKYNEENLTNIVFPATYFYPLTAANASKHRAPIRCLREKFYGVLESLHLRSPRAFSQKCPETIAVHYWGNAWIPTPSEQIRELQQQIDIMKRDFYTVQKKLHQMEQSQVSLKKSPSHSSEPEMAVK